MGSVELCFQVPQTRDFPSGQGNQDEGKDLLSLPSLSLKSTGLKKLKLQEFGEISHSVDSVE